VNQVVLATRCASLSVLSPGVPRIADLPLFRSTVSCSSRSSTDTRLAQATAEMSVDEAGRCGTETEIETAAAHEEQCLMASR
jgi:hypothetical protein